MERITRRLFLRNTAAASAVAATVAAPVIVEAATVSPRERLDAAIVELRSAMKICASGHHGSWSVFLIGNRSNGRADITSASCANATIDLLEPRSQGPIVRAHFDDGSPLLADDASGTTAYADWERSKGHA